MARTQRLYPQPARGWRRVSLALLACGALFLPSDRSRASLPAPAPAQQSVPESQRPLRVQVQLVNLFVTARDNKKRIVPDLKQEDFRVREDGQEQKVEYFSREVALPVTLGMLLDTSGSEEHMLGAIQQAASRFLRHTLRKGDLAMVISFDMDVNLLADFTQDVEQLEDAIRRARIHAPRPPPTVQGPFPQLPQGTSFYDAVYLACMEKLRPEAGRKALVILTDATDYGSKVRLEQAVEAAQRTDTVVHILLVYDPRYGADTAVARKFAEETGGRVISVRSEKKLEEAFAQIAEELRTQYTLGYYPTHRARDGKFRRIQVEVARKGINVLARKGYYAPKD